MARQIDRSPQGLTGDTQKDLQAVMDYLTYLREQINFILAGLGKGGEAQ